MRLIDADELKKDDEVTQWLSLDAVRTGKTLKMFSELFIKKIDKQPTVQAIPIEVLQKIRREIDNLTVIWPEGGIGMISKFLVMDIIDNHIKEGET